MDTRHPDEGTIHAYVESQLPRAEYEQVDAHVAACAQCADAVAEARGLIAASSRIVSALDGVPAGVLPRSGRRRTWLPAWLPVAAVGLLAVGISSVALRDGVRMSVVDGTEGERQIEDTTRPAAMVGEERAPQPEPPEAPVVERGAPTPVSGASATQGPISPQRAPEIRQRAAMRADMRVGDTAGDELQERPLAFISPAAAAPDALPGLVVSGRVRSQGRPIAGAMVSIDSLNVRARTDSAGRYRIELPSGVRIADAAISARRIGYDGHMQRIVGTSDSQIVDFELPAASLQLSGVMTTSTLRAERTLGAPASVTVAGAAAPLRAVRYRATREAIIELQEFHAGEPVTSRPPAGSSEYRWRDDARQRVFVLTGPFTAAELERFAHRLADLEVVP